MTPPGEDKLDDAMTEYAIEHLDWPDNPQALDKFLTEKTMSDKLPPGEDIAAVAKQIVALTGHLRDAGIDMSNPAPALARAVLALQEQNEGLRKATEDIVRWSRAYPIEVFPEPDLKKAAELLKAGGISMDAVSASAMRHVVTGVGEIAAAALAAARREGGGEKVNP